MTGGSRRRPPPQVRSWAGERAVEPTSGFEPETSFLPRISLPALWYPPVAHERALPTLVWWAPSESSRRLAPLSRVGSLQRDGQNSATQRQIANDHGPRNSHCAALPESPWSCAEDSANGRRQSTGRVACNHDAGGFLHAAKPASVTCPCTRWGGQTRIRRQGFCPSASKQ